MVIKKFWFLCLILSTTDSSTDWKLIIRTINYGR